LLIGATLAWIATLIWVHVDTTELCAFAFTNSCGSHWSF
jgi:hypothetical protein